MKKKTMKQILGLSITTNVVMVLAFIMLTLNFNSYKESNNKKVSEMIALYEQKEFQYDMLFTQHKKMTDMNISLLNVANEVDTQNELLKNDSKSLQEELAKFQQREELYNKYEYYMTYGGERTDFTYEELASLEEFLKDEKVNDADLYLSWILVETGGRADAKNPISTARGYGQFLNSTSEFVYTDLLGYENWTKEVAFNGTTSLEMMVALVNYLYDINGENLQRTINSYRGLYDAPYIAKIESHLSNRGKSIQSISDSIKSNE